MYYTIVYKSGICPYWKVHVQLQARYYYSEEKGKEHEAGLALATCPIIEDSSLPFEKQRKEYRLLRCHNPDCKLLNGFPKHIDTRTNQPI